MCPLCDPVVLELNPHPRMFASWFAGPPRVFKLSRIVLQFFCILEVLLNKNVTKKCGASLQRRSFSSIDIFESLLKGKFAMELLCKFEVVVEECFGTFHKENNFAYAWN